MRLWTTDGTVRLEFRRSRARAGGTVVLLMALCVGGTLAVLGPEQFADQGLPPAIVRAVAGTLTVLLGVMAVANVRANAARPPLWATPDRLVWSSIVGTVVVPLDAVTHAGVVDVAPDRTWAGIAVSDPSRIEFPSRLRWVWARNGRGDWSVVISDNRISAAPDEIAAVINALVSDQQAWQRLQRAPAGVHDVGELLDLLGG